MTWFSPFGLTFLLGRNGSLDRTKRVACCTSVDQPHVPIRHVTLNEILLPALENLKWSHHFAAVRLFFVAEKAAESRTIVRKENLEAFNYQMVPCCSFTTTLIAVAVILVEVVLSVFLPLVFRWMLSFGSPFFSNRNRTRNGVRIQNRKYFSNNPRGLSKEQ